MTELGDKIELEQADPQSGGDNCACIPLLGASNSTFELFTEGDYLYNSMLSAIAGAQQSIDMESYIFADDEVGRWIAEALVDRARTGVKVRLHLDAAGSLFCMSQEFENYLLEHNVELRWFHRWSWRKPWRYNRRNHRKLLVIDYRLAYLGGFNIHRVNSRKIYGEKRWRDTHVLLQGPIVSTASDLFEAFWCGRLRWLPDSIPSNSSLVHNHTLSCRYRLRCIYSDLFSSAKNYLFLTTPYFVPDHAMQRGLIAAARRGVDVRVLVPRKSDVRLALWASRYAYANLLNAGVRIFEYLPRMLHAKTFVVDGERGMIGTANLDYRSLFLNYELNLVTKDPGFSLRLERQFLVDLSAAERILPAQWKTRGWKGRVSESIGWIARRWL